MWIDCLVRVDRVNQFIVTCSASDTISETVGLQHRNSALIWNPGSPIRPINNRR